MTYCKHCGATDQGTKTIVDGGEELEVCEVCETFGSVCDLDATLDDGEWEEIA